MAHSDSIPDAVLEAIASEIGLRVAPVATKELANVHVELAETFAVWMLGLDATTQQEDDISKFAINTSLWHHQIRFDGKAEAFARSTPLGPDPKDWSIEQVSEQSLAQKIDEAIQWIDANVKNDPLVRLLIIPAYYLEAFWLRKDNLDQILVVDRPDGYTTIQYKILYKSRDFLETLSREKHAQGIVAPIP